MTLKQLYFGRGKLLLSSEYFVLDGALALALPTHLGQQMSVEIEKHETASMLQWQAVDSKGEVWFEALFSAKKYHVIESTDKATAIALQTILRAVDTEKDFIPEHHITKVKTVLDFPITWGLGSSSTLIYMIAKWTGMNPFHLLKETFGGSGYDIVCAGEEKPILYQLLANKTPNWQTIDFNPPFKNDLYFIYLGKKQDSRKGIKHYREQVKHPEKYQQICTELTHAICEAKDLTTFEKALSEHEKLISTTLKMKTSQNLYFEDYKAGVIKSLGAWGGDFVLATSNQSIEATKKYFNNKGMDIVLPYRKLIV